MGRSGIWVGTLLMTYQYLVQAVATKTLRQCGQGAWLLVHDSSVQCLGNFQPSAIDCLDELSAM